MDQSQMKRGRMAYEKIHKCTENLVETGNWQRVGTRDVGLFMDMYVQSLLLNMVQAEGATRPDTLSFISAIPRRDILKVGQLTPEQALQVGFKNRSFAEGTPLLLRCCMAMDEKSGTKTASEFVEAVSELLFACAEIDGDMSGRELQFITRYAGAMRTFMMTRAAGRYQKVETPDPEAAREGGKAPEPAKTEAPQEEETLEELLAELDSLIGLGPVKKEVHTLINLIRVRQMRKDHGLKVMKMSFHMVFTGNPGTGKTTVARLVAKIYRKLGFLSQGQLIETDRSGLVAGYVGQTAGKVTEVVNSALGGILFIDEAYALSRKGMDNDFGREAIDTLVKLMEDHRDDLVVIVAGYTHEMHDFLTANPGLISRFNKYIDFADYTDDELMQILHLTAGKQGYTVSEEADKVVRQMLLGMTLGARMDFGNARGMRNVLEKMVEAQANRIAALEGEITREMLQKITGEDARAALNMEAEQSENDRQQVDETQETLETEPAPDKEPEGKTLPSPEEKHGSD